VFGRRAGARSSAIAALFIATVASVTVLGRPGSVSPLDQSKLYPLLVPTGYFGERVSAVHRPLLSNIEVALVVEEEHPERVPGPHAADSLVRYIQADELRAIGLTLDEAYKLALEHLERAAEKGIVEAHLFKGDDGKAKFVVWSGHWLSATFILLQGLPKMASSALGTTKLIAMIPHRESLVVFPDGPDRQRSIDYFLEKEGEGRKSLTRRPLSFTAGKPAEFWRRAPVAYAD
jgi:hypothetical protein